MLDFNATEAPVHSRREVRFSRFCGDIPLWGQLRSSDQDASAGTVEALEKMVPAIRARFHNAKRQSRRKWSDASNSTTPKAAS